MSGVTSKATGREGRLFRALADLSRTPPARSRDAKGTRDRATPKPGQSENLVFEFDEAYTAFVDGFETLPEESQLLALQAVDRQVAAMVAAQDVALWTDQGWREADEWQLLRKLSARVLAEFGWGEPGDGIPGHPSDHETDTLPRA